MKKRFAHNNLVRDFGVLLILSLFTFNGSAQNAARKFTGYEKEGNSVTIITGDGNYRIIYYTPEIVETSFIPTGENYKNDSTAVVLELQPVPFSNEENEDSLILDSDGIDIYILKSPFQIVYYYNGEKVISEKTGYSKNKEHEKIDFNIEEEEMLFGGGANDLGKNRRNNTSEFNNPPSNENKDTTVLRNSTRPMVFSSKKYMIHFDNPSNGFQHLNKENNTLTYETIEGKKTYQLVVGDSREKLIENFTSLTGRQPMPPRWVLGNLSGIYQSQKEVIETLERFKKDSIPVDAMIIDLMRSGGGIKDTVGNTELKNKFFPEPEKMIVKLQEEGIKTIFGTKPFVFTDSQRVEEGVDKEGLTTYKSGQPLMDTIYAALTWEGLRSHLKMTLQMGMQGMGYPLTDFGDAGVSPKEELYLRWLQYSVFQPVFRTIAPNVFSEPQFKDPFTRKFANNAIELRYKLLPYNYTLAFENSRSGMPLMRPIFIEEPENREIFNVSHTYLWGSDFLISPVLDTAVAVKEIYFPGKDNWFDFYTGSKYQGGSTHSVQIKKDHIPTYVKGGAFIPMAKHVQTTVDYSVANLQIHYYYDSQVSKSSTRVYHDDGRTIDSYDKGKYEILNLSSSSNNNSLTITVEKKEGENSDSEIQLVEVIIENLKMPVDVVWVKTLRFTSKNFMHQGRLVIPVRFDENTTTIKLEFN